MRTPAPLLACGLISMTALYLNAGTFLGLSILGALWLIAAFTPGRIPAGFIVSWGIRVAGFLVILLLMGAPDSEISQWYVKPEYTSRAGVLLAFELVLRAWRDRALTTRTLGDQLVVAGLILMAACNTFDRAVVTVAVPLWIIAALGVVRRMNLIEMPHSARPSGSGSPLPHNPRPSRLLQGKRLAALAIAMGIGLAAVSAVQVFDRQVSTWAVNFLQAQFNPSRGQIGLAMSPRLQGIFNPAASAQRVLRLEGFSGERHLRAIAYWAYLDGAWLPRESERSYKPIAAADLRGNPTRGERERALRVVSLSSDIQGLLIVPADAVGIDVSPETGGAPVEVDGTFSLRVVRGSLAPSWNVRISGEGIFAPMLPAPNGGELAALKWWPDEVDPRVRDIAISVAGDAEPEEKIARIAAHLRSNNQYSLSYQPDGEPLSDFILNRRAAHCQYFASAVVIMARAVGLPARFVTGFYAYEPDGNGTVVRQRDAHAWAEVYIENRGWTVVDATPSSGRPPELFGEVGTARRVWEWLTDQPARLRELLFQLGLVRLVICVAAAFAVIYAVQWLRAHRTGGPISRPSIRPLDPRLLAAARHFETWLAKRGTPCPPGKTWREHVGNDALATPFLSAYETARFGNGDADEAIRNLPPLK